MSKIISLRLTNEEHRSISRPAPAGIIKKHKQLTGRLAKAHKDAAGMKGKLIG